MTLPEPTQFEVSKMKKDVASINILRNFQPLILNSLTPLYTVGDGNCMYRAISLGLYGNEDMHLLLRLYTSLELVLHRATYDSNHPDFSPIITDNRIIVPPYSDLLSSATNVFSWSEMIHMYAASAVIGEPIGSYYPPFGTSILEYTIQL